MIFLDQYSDNNIIVVLDFLGNYEKKTSLTKFEDFLVEHIVEKTIYSVHHMVEFQL